MYNVNDESELHLESGVCAVKFSATWCSPCKQMEPTIEKLESEFQNAKFISIDIDEVPSIVQRYKIRSLPTLLIMKDGQEVNRVIVLSLIEPLRKILRDVLTDKAIVDI